LAAAVFVTFLFCFFWLVKPPARGLPGSSRPFFVLVVFVCGSIPLIMLAWPACTAVWNGQAIHALNGQFKQIGLAMLAYGDREGHFPPSAIYGKNGEPLLSWRVALLPYLGHEHLFQQFKLDEPWDSPHNLTLVDQIPDVYGLPWYFDERADRKTTYFQVYVGPGTAFEGKKGISIRDFPNGISDTVLVAIAPDPVIWTKPADIEFLPQGSLILPKNDRYWQQLVIFADGSVQDARTRNSWEALTDEQWRALIMRNSGKPRDRLR
jgi:hypothetical protein